MNYLLFSKRRKMWWLPNGAGYCPDIESAGWFSNRYSYALCSALATTTRRISEAQLPDFAGMTNDQIAEALP